MPTLIFDSDDHRYTVDGEEVPSVSELTKFIANEVYSDTPQYFLDQAAKKGTSIHKATEAIDLYGQVECEEDIVPYVQAYVQFRKDIQPEWEKVEWSVCNEKKYAGTVDRYGKMNGLNVILDIKSTANITGLHKTLYRAAQNLYRLAVMKEKPVDGLWILQLKKDATYKLIQLDVDEPLAFACITLHEAIKNSKKRRKKND